MEKKRKKFLLSYFKGILISLGTSVVLFINMCIFMLLGSLFTNTTHIESISYVLFILAIIFFFSSPIIGAIYLILKIVKHTLTINKLCTITNRYVEKMLSDTVFTTYCCNFVKNNDFDTKVLQYSFIPLDLYSTEIKMKGHNTYTSYLKYSYAHIDYSQSNVEIAYNIQTKNFVNNQAQKYKCIYTFYTSLVNQSILKKSKDEVQYLAFLYILYLYAKIFDYEKAVEDMIADPKVNTILRNYASSIDILPHLLEFAFVPLEFINNSYLLKTDPNEFTLGNSPYLKQLSLYNQSIIDSYTYLVKFGYAIQKKNFELFDKYDENKSVILDTYSLFDTLINQKVIQTNDEKHYYAYLYLIYRYKKISYFEQIKNCLEKLDLTTENDNTTIITKLHNNNYNEFQIKQCLSSANNRNCDYVNLLCIEWDKKYDSIIQNTVFNLKETERINNLLKYQKKKIRLAITDIDLMTGTDFENFIGTLFNRLGYKTIVTKASGDQGVDVIAQKDEIKIAIQAKCYSKPVGNDAIQEVVAGAHFYQTDQCMVITNRTFTKSAIELAKANNVILKDRDFLIEKIKELF